MYPHDRVCFILCQERFRSQYRATKVTAKMLFSVDFFSRPFDHFLSPSAPGAYQQDRTVVHKDSQWGGPEPAPALQINRADQLHQVLYTIQDAASLWYPSDFAAVFRSLHGDSVRSLQPTAPAQLLYAMCNLHQAIFSDLFDDLLHGVDLRRVGSRALSSLRSDSPTYQRLVTRVMNDAVVASVFSTASSGLPGRQDTRRPPARGQAAHRDTRPARARPAAESSITPKQIRYQIPVVNGKQVCVRFQSAKGCTFPSCKHLHELHRLPPDVLKWVTEMHMGLKAAHPQRE